MNSSWPEVAESMLLELYPSGEAPRAELISRLTAQLSPRHAGDQVLVAACLLETPAALSRLEALLAREAAPVGASFGLDAAEVQSLARARLFERVDGVPRLASYDGSGPLGAWLRTVAARMASNARRAVHHETGASAAGDVTAPTADPELALLRLQYKTHFRSAFAAAVESLTPRERTVLRLHALDGLSLASIGAMYRRDASTVSRWLDAVRRQLLDGTRAQLASALSLSPSELESLQRGATTPSVSLSVLLEESSPG